MKSKKRVSLISALYFLTAFGSQLIVGVIFGIISGIIIGIQVAITNQGNIIPGDGIQPQIETLIANNINSIVIATYIMAVCIYLLAFAIKKKKFLPACDFRRTTIKSLLLSAVIGISLNFVNAGIMGITAVEKLFPEHNNIVKSLIGGPNVFLVIIHVAILAPIFEEMVFRGLIMKELRKGFSMVAAVGIQAFLFGLFHFNVLQGIYSFFIGIAAAVVCIWGGSLWNAIVLHLVFNSTSLIMVALGFEPNMIHYGIMILVGGMIMCAATIYFKKNKIEVLQPFEEVNQEIVELSR